MVVHGIDVETFHHGSGHAIVLLHGFQPIDPSARFVSMLSQHAKLTAPSYPGFGKTPRPESFETAYDLINFCSAFLDAQPDEQVTLIGLSFGGWVACEIMVRSCHNIHQLVLVDPVGVKLSDRETPDILDIFNTHPDKVRRATWHNLANAPDFDAMTDEQLTTYHRGWESLSLYAWHPYMHNPRLAYWLPRISVPTLVLWGAQDGIVRPAYGEAFAKLIPGAQFSLIDQAGHRPEIEQPEVFVDHLVKFLRAGD